MRLNAPTAVYFVQSIPRYILVLPHNLFNLHTWSPHVLACTCPTNDSVLVPKVAILLDEPCEVRFFPLLLYSLAVSLDEEKLRCVPLERNNISSLASGWRSGSSPSTLICACPRDISGQNRCERGPLFWLICWAAYAPTASLPTPVSKQDKPEMYHAQAAATL